MRTDPVGNLFLHHEDAEFDQVGIFQEAKKNGRGHIIREIAHERSGSVEGRCQVPFQKIGFDDLDGRIGEGGFEVSHCFRIEFDGTEIRIAFEEVFGQYPHSRSYFDHTSIFGRVESIDNPSCNVLIRQKIVA